MLGLSHQKSGKALRGALGAATAIVVLLTAAGYLGESWWIFDLVSHFRVQYALLLVPLAILFAVERLTVWASLAAAGLIINLAVIIPLYIPPATAAPGSGPAVRIIQLNVFRDNTSFDRVFSWLARQEADIVVLEEVNLAWMKHLRQIEPRQFAFRKGVAREDAFGIAILSRLPFKNVEIVYSPRIDAPVIVADFMIEGRPLRVIGAHAAPPLTAFGARARERQVSSLRRLTADGENVVLLGDLNSTSWSPVFQRLVNGTGLSDSRRGFGVQPTWPTWFPWPQLAIDHVLTSEAVSVRDRRLGPDLGSDHLPVIIDILVGDERRWRRLTPAAKTRLRPETP